MDDRKGKVVYFAHPKNHYDTDIEWECIDVIVTMLTPIGEDATNGYIHIMNPNQRWLQNLYNRRRKDENIENPFEIFNEIALSCDMIVGCTFMNGSIGAGVAEELKTCIEAEIPAYLIYISENRRLFLPCVSLENYNVLTIEETKEKIKRGVM